MAAAAAVAAAAVAAAAAAAAAAASTNAIIKDSACALCFIYGYWNRMHSSPILYSNGVLPFPAIHLQSTHPVAMQHGANKKKLLKNLIFFIKSSWIGFNLT